jgi:hypothetical protein
MGATKGAMMGEIMMFLEDGTVQTINSEGNLEDIVIYCDLCNEPIAITTKLGCDDVFLQCLKCHAITNTNG